MYWVRIGGMRLRLPELQAKNQAARENRQQDLKKCWTEIEGVLHFQGLPYVPEIIRMELIKMHHDNLLTVHFGIKKCNAVAHAPAYETYVVPGSPT